MLLTNIAETSWFEYATQKRHTDLYQIGYDEKTLKRVVKKVTDYIPYFYVAKDYDIESIIPCKIEKCDVKSLFGDEVKKVIVPDLNEYEGARAQLFDSFEADVKHYQRYIIDKSVEFYKDQRILFLDIETDMSIDPFNTPKPVISISAYDSKTEKYVCFLWASKLAIIDGVEVRMSNSEKALLSDFMSYFMKISPDIVTGWNADHFDLPYLINRCAKLGVNFRVMSPINSVYVRTYEDRITKKPRIEATIKGISIVDLRSIFRKIPLSDHAPENLKLDTVAKSFLGEAKKDFGKVGDLWRNNPQKLIEYNLHDVKLVVMLENKVKFVHYFLIVQQIVPINLEDIFFNTKVVDALVLKRFHNRYVFPSKKMGEKHAFKGAHVFESATGLFDGVSVLDFASMYPSIYVTFNISPETICNERTPNDVKVDEVIFSTKTLGIIPETLLSTLKERARFKTERDKYKANTIEWNAYDDLQNAFKELNNTMYGAMGYENFRLFNLSVANSITSVGRELIQHASKIAEGEGYTILGGDTDSIFVWKQGNSPEKSEALQKKINDSLSGFCRKFTSNKDIIKNHKLKTEFERFYETIMFTGVKKRYFGHLVYKKGKQTDEWYGRGFEHVRRDTPDVFKILLKAIYKKILLKEDPKSIRQFIEEEKVKIRATMTMWDLGMTRTFNKEFGEYKTLPKHVRAFKYSNDYLGSDFKVGDFQKTVFVKMKRLHDRKYPETDVIGIDDGMEIPDCFQTDYESFFDLFIEKKLELLKGVIMIPTDLNQKLLGDF